MVHPLQQLIDSFIGNRGGMRAISDPRMGGGQYAHPDPINFGGGRFATPDPRMGGRFAHPDPINTGGMTRLPIGGTNNSGGRYLPPPTPRYGGGAQYMPAPPPPVLRPQPGMGGGMAAHLDPRNMGAFMPSGRAIPDPFRR